MSKGGGGYTHVHTPNDAYSRLAYSEFAGTENTINCVASSNGCWPGSPSRNITIKPILTDNGNSYRCMAWRDLCAELGSNTPAPSRTRQRRTRTSRQFNRTLLDEWALDPSLHRYNHHRHPVDGPPASRSNNLAVPCS